MKYYIIAGEASGDLHGANLMKGILKCDPEAEFRFWGGDKMSEVGGWHSLAKHYKEASFMGFFEVAKNFKIIRAQLKECKQDVVDYNPDVVILIDYPGFNFRIAKHAKKHGLKTFYYISPKVWAWKESRVKLIKKYVDQLFIIFPFEIEYFKKKGVNAYYAGNPLMDAIEQRKDQLSSNEQFRSDNGLDSRPIIALLAGSRKHEIDYNFAFMVNVSKRFPDYQFVVAGVSWLDKSIYDKHIAGSDVRYVSDKTYELLSHSSAAIVTSGTATLETALLKVPEFICFWCDAVTYHVAKNMLKIKYISLVNLIMDRPVVREIIRAEMTVDNAEQELRAILPGGAKHEKMMADYAELREVVGGGGASDRFAARMVELLNEK